MQKSVIFLHLPKTGGTSLRNILNREYAENTRLLIYTYPHFPKKDGIVKLQKLSNDKRAKLELIYGHFAFGIHEYLPQESTYITFLRDPVDRIISHFYFVKKRNIKAHVGNMKGNTLEEYLNKGLDYELNNGMTRLLCCDDKIQKNSTITRSDLEIAKTNLDKHFSFVGILDEFRNGLLILSNLLNWEKDLVFVKTNVTRHPSKEEIPKYVIKKIMKMNELDMELYQYARKKYSDMRDSHKHLIKKSV